MLWRKINKTDLLIVISRQCYCCRKTIKEVPLLLLSVQRTSAERKIIDRDDEISKESREVRRYGNENGSGKKVFTSAHFILPFSMLCILFRVVLLSSLSHSLSFSFSLFLSLSLFFVRLSAESKFFCRPFSMSALICTLHTLKLM